MSRRLLIQNASLVLSDRVVEGDLRVADTQIVKVAPVVASRQKNQNQFLTQRVFTSFLVQSIHRCISANQASQIEKILEVVVGLQQRVV